MPHHCSKLHKDSWVFPPSSTSAEGKKGRRNMSKSGCKGAAEMGITSWWITVPEFHTQHVKCRNLQWTLFDSTVTHMLQGFCDPVTYQSIFWGNWLCVGSLTECSTFSWVMWKMPVNLFRSFFSKFFFRIAKNNIEMSTTLLPPKPSKTSFRDFRGIRPIYLEPKKCPASNQPHPYKWFWQITFGLLIWGFLYLAICNPLKKLDS